MKLLRALGAGLVGAAAVTIMTEIARRIYPEAPRLDLLGMRAVTKTMQKTGIDVPDRQQVFNIAMAGDLLSNTAYYSLVGTGKADQTTWVRGGILGLLAGLGGLIVPSMTGLGNYPTNRSLATQLLTIGYYLFGGMAAAETYRLMGRYMGED